MTQASNREKLSRVRNAAPGFSYDAPPETGPMAWGGAAPIAPPMARPSPRVSLPPLTGSRTPIRPTTMGEPSRNAAMQFADEQEVLRRSQNIGPLASPLMQPLANLGDPDAMEAFGDEVGDAFGSGMRALGRMRAPSFSDVGDVLQQAPSAIYEGARAAPSALYEGARSVPRVASDALDMLDGGIDPDADPLTRIGRAAMRFAPIAARSMTYEPWDNERYNRRMADYYEYMGEPEQERDALNEANLQSGFAALNMTLPLDVAGVAGAFRRAPVGLADDAGRGAATGAQAQPTRNSFRGGADDLREAAGMQAAPEAPAPIDAFHGTTTRHTDLRGPMYPFTHVGTRRAARDRVAAVRERGEPRNIIPVRIRGGQVIDMAADSGLQHDSGMVLRGLRQGGKFTDEEWAYINEPYELARRQTPEGFELEIDGRFPGDVMSERAAEVLSRNGVSALRYRNGVEDTGSYSYIVPDSANMQVGAPRRGLFGTRYEMPSEPLPALPPPQPRAPPLTTPTGTAPFGDPRAFPPQAWDDFGSPQAPSAGNAGGGQFRLPSDIRAPKENIGEVIDANFNHGMLVGDETVPIGDLIGGASSAERGRVGALARSIADPESGYFERIIVDDANNVIEGQHRLDALRELGASEVPIVRVRDTMRDFDEGAIADAMQTAGPMHRDQVNSITRQLGRLLARERGDVAAVRENWEPPRGFERQWEAALTSLERPANRLPDGGNAGVPLGERIVRNPSGEQLIQLLGRSDGHLRAVFDDSGMYVFDARSMIHKQGADAAGIPYNNANRGDVRLVDGLPEISLPEEVMWTPDFLNHRGLSRYLRDSNVLFNAGSEGLMTGPEYARHLGQLPNASNPLQGAEPSAGASPRTPPLASAAPIIAGGAAGALALSGQEASADTGEEDNGGGINPLVPIAGGVAALGAGVLGARYLRGRGRSAARVARPAANAPPLSGIAPIATGGALGAGAFLLGQEAGAESDGALRAEITTTQGALSRIDERLEVLENVDSSNPDSVAAAQRILGVSVDGRMGPETRPAIAQRIEQLRADKEAASARLSELEQTDAVQRLSPSPEEEAQRELMLGLSAAGGALLGKYGLPLPRSAPLVGPLSGALGRSGTAHGVERQLAEQTARAEAIQFPTNPLPARRGASSDAQASARAARVNEFWAYGGAGDRVPFRVGTGRLPEIRPGSVEAQSLFNPPRFSGEDLGYMGLGALDAGAAALMLPESQQNLEEASLAYEEEPTEANLVQVEQARDAVMRLELMGRVGAGYIGGRIVGGYTHGYERLPRPGFSAAQAEQGRVARYVAPTQPRRPPR